MSLLSVHSLKIEYETSAGPIYAVNDVSFEIAPGETVGLVGESGCGKSTLSKAVMRLIPSSEGRIFLDGKDITKMGPAEMRPIRSKMQMIFQDPLNSLNPRRTVGSLISQPMQVAGWSGENIRNRMAELMTQVGLPPDAAPRYPHEFSGGQRQRIGIARALAVDPEFVVADEPVSALDVSIQAQVINLLDDLKDALNLTMLFIAHDLAVVEHICDRVTVMYLGRIMEIAPASTLYSAPNHPYTQALLSAIPIPKPGRKHSRVVLKGDIPSPINPPSGCVFRTRCPRAIGDCATIVPTLKPVGPDHFSACIITT